MDQDELLHELEALVTAMEQSLAIITGTLAEAAGPGPTLQRLVQGQQSMERLHGANDWRDRLMGSSVKLAGIMAMSVLNRGVSQGEPDDPDLRVLIDSALSGRLPQDA